MLPISEKLARAYQEKHPGVVIHIEGGDSSLGIRGVSSGIVDIASASRPLTEKEAGRLQSYTITSDSISIIVNKQNPVKQLAISQIRGVFIGEIKNWNQLGGTDSPITLVTRERGSGTHSVFDEMVMQHRAIDERALVMTSTGSVISTIAGDVNAIGYVSSDYSAAGVGAVEIHTGENKVFILERPLLYVISGNPSSLAKDYITYCTGVEGQSIAGHTKN